MEIINFEDAKIRKQSKVRNKDILELQRQYREYAEFCNQWYDEHVIGQDKDGSWIYKD